MRTTLFGLLLLFATHLFVGAAIRKAKFRIDYFLPPEYYTIDGRPVVLIWSPKNMDNNRDNRKFDF